MKDRTSLKYACRFGGLFLSVFYMGFLGYMFILVHMMQLLSFCVRVTVDNNRIVASVAIVPVSFCHCQFKTVHL